MVYITYIFNLIANIMSTIIIPIPFSEDKVFYLSIFSIFMGLLVISIIVYFITKLLGIETNMFWGYVSDGLSWDNNKYKGTDNISIEKDAKTDTYKLRHVRRYTKKL